MWQEWVFSKQMGYGVMISGALLYLNPIHTIPTGQRALITQFDVIRGIAGEGVVLLPPWQTLKRFDLRVQEQIIEGASAITGDAQFIQTSFNVRYQLAPDRIVDIYKHYSYKGDMTSYLQTETQEAFRIVAARYKSQDLSSQREKLLQDIFAELKNKLAFYGVILISVNLGDVALLPT